MDIFVFFLIIDYVENRKFKKFKRIIYRPKESFKCIRYSELKKILYCVSVSFGKRKKIEGKAPKRHVSKLIHNGFFSFCC